MKSEDLEKEQAVLRRIVEASHAIRRKYQQIKMGKVATEKSFDDMFKPVVSPLKELVKQKEQEVVPPLKMEPEPELKPEPEEEDDVMSNKTIIQLRSSLPKKDLDETLGVRLLKKNNRLMIGNTPIDFDANHVHVGYQRYPFSPGLLELLMKQNPDRSIVTAQDMENYQAIVLNTNAHRKNYQDRGGLRQTHPKYQNFISKSSIVKSKRSQKSGSGFKLPKSMLLKRGVKPEYVYWDCADELVSRLYLLASSYQAGNRGHTNEILSIIEELREANLIY